MASATHERVLERLWPSGPDTQAWAVLDGARDPRVYERVTSSSLPHLCLYTGELAPSLARVAPYLVRLSREAPFTATLLDEGWGESWGVFLRAGATMSALHRHLRRFLRVRDERGKTMLFRYYDPRVLRVYLPTCTPGELETFFGPIASFVLEDDEPTTVLTLRRNAAGLARDELRVEQRLHWLGDYLRKERDDASR